jgi:hypothetical protein
MRIGGYKKVPDYVKLGPSLLIASCVILAIRTSKWAVRAGGPESQRDLDAEVDNAIFFADRVLSQLLKTKADLFPSKDVPWHVAAEEDSPM